MMRSLIARLARRKGAEMGEPEARERRRNVVEADGIHDATNANRDRG